MFIRSIKVPSSSGVVHEYVRVVESVRENGRVKQRVVLNLGRRDTLVELLPLLQRFLQGDTVAPFEHDGPIQTLDASTWGPMLVVRHFFQQLGLWQILDAGRRWPRLLPAEDPDDDWPSRVLALIANRLVRPVSEHALAGWLETDYVCDRLGRRYVTRWKRQGRVEVDLTVLQRWYRTLDHLVLNKAKIEVALYKQLRDLFDFQPDLVFYDLTSTYFAGQGPAALAKHGYSRDGKPRNVQVVVGVVMVAGWPITHHVWAGNTRDSQTVSEVVKDLTKRFQFRDVVFVGDRGMVTEKNLDVLQKADGDWGFLLGMTRRQNPAAEALIDRIVEDRWLECPGGINTEEAHEKQRTRVQEVTCDRPGVRVFIVDSDERRAYEQRQREKAMQRVRVGLEKLQRRVAKGQVKAPAKIGAAAQRVLSRNHGQRYYAWKLEGGQFHFEEHPVNLPREKKYEGKYLIQTDRTDLTPREGVAHYKELNEVERGFRSLKDPIGMRPIWHHCERRVKAHIFVATLAFLIERMLERALKDARVPLSAQAALTALQTIRHVRFQVDGQERTGVTPGSQRARQVLKALKITEIRPPAPPGAQKTTM
ncbi:MAG: IS1634 family transposase [Nitrospirae bacterium]|nr:MAG: IS1634 family transposase [Nitrospirota bacterium]